LKLNRAILAAMLLSVVAASAQASGTSAKPAPAASKSALPIVNAEVRKIDQAAGMIVLRHGDIPNMGMPAMTMAFDVADKKMLTRVKPGDKVKFQADMIQGKATVVDLKPAR
jgi:Cu(I)/Ag(I) efflux system periplasmic protein CusF